MANPIAVKGIKRIVDKLGDEVLEAAHKFIKQGGKGTFEGSGRVLLDGKYAIDKSGEVGIVGNVVVNSNLPLPTTLGAEGDVDVHTSGEWNSLGDGIMQVEFVVKVNIPFVEP